MLKSQTVLTLGIWILVLPFLGFPDSWKTILLVVTGFFLLGSYGYRRYNPARTCGCGIEKESTDQVFIDNRNSTLAN
ncbi:MAG TPA: hypothetical protein VJH55_00835 [Candidatus Paceibacterota bacterium]